MTIPKEGVFGELSTRETRLVIMTAGLVAFLLACIPFHWFHVIVGVLGLIVSLTIIFNQYKRVEAGQDPKASEE